MSFQGTMGPVCSGSVGSRCGVSGISPGISGYSTSPIHTDSNSSKCSTKGGFVGRNTQIVDQISSCASAREGKGLRVLLHPLSGPETVRRVSPCDGLEGSKSLSQAFDIQDDNFARNLSIAAKRGSSGILGHPRCLSPCPYFFGSPEISEVCCWDRS